MGPIRRCSVQVGDHSVGRHAEVGNGTRREVGRQCGLGPVPAILNVVTVTPSGEPQTLVLSEGFAAASEATPWTYVCPAAWGELPASPSAVAVADHVYFFVDHDLLSLNPDGDLQHACTGFQHGLDFAWEHVFAAYDEHVLGTTRDVQEAVFVDPSDVAGTKPAVGDHLRRFFRSLRIARHG